MKRFHKEITLMNTRLRLERWFHERFGESYEECHCYKKKGLFRKNHPLMETSKLLRYWEDFDQKVQVRRERRARLQLLQEAEQLDDLTCEIRRNRR